MSRPSALVINVSALALGLVFLFFGVIVSSVYNIQMDLDPQNALIYTVLLVGVMGLLVIMKGVYDQL